MRRSRNLEETNYRTEKQETEYVEKLKLHGISKAVIYTLFYSKSDDSGHVIHGRTHPAFILL